MVSQVVAEFYSPLPFCEERSGGNSATAVFQTDPGQLAMVSPTVPCRRILSEYGNVRQLAFLGKAVLGQRRRSPAPVQLFAVAEKDPAC
jgi:hypothetical protein